MAVPALGLARPETPAQNSAYRRLSLGFLLPLMHRRLLATAWLLVAAAALALRLPRLGERPMHLDEAVQALKTGALIERGFYRYDPTEFHGPTLYYAAAPIAWLAGRGRFADTDEADYRVVDVIFGVLLVLLPWGLREALGELPALTAAALAAVSPACAYYSRYYMQEPLLVFFTAAALAAAWRYAQRPSWGWAAAAGACLALMHATKETSVVAYACMLAAAGAARRLAPQEFHRSPAWRWHAAVAAAAAGAVWLVLFSSFFTNPAGLWDSVRTYAYYARRARGGNPHIHSWAYYFRLLLWFRYGSGPVWTEAFIFVLAAAGAVAALRKPRRRALVFLACFAAVMTAAYAVIPYKTPWCALNFLYPLILLAGVGAGFLLDAARPRRVRTAAAALLALGTAHLAWQAWRACYAMPADPRNPYVYAHTSPDILRLARRLDDLAAAQPAGRRLLVEVIARPQDYWPLPWYLRKFPNVGYYAEPPREVRGDVVIASLSFLPAVEAKRRGTDVVEYYALRPDVLLAASIRRRVWDAFMRKRR